jgi:hypothetical protein
VTGVVRFKPDINFGSSPSNANRGQTRVYVGLRLTRSAMEEPILI